MTGNGVRVDTEDEAYWRIVMHRGLGDNIERIAGKTGLTVEQVRYRLRHIRSLVEDHGEEKVFYQMVIRFLTDARIREYLAK